MKLLSIFSIFLLFVLFLPINSPVFANERSVSVKKRLAMEAGVKVGSFNALIIGIDNYSDPKIPNLKTAVKDARKVSAVLKQFYGFQKVTLLLNEDATSSGIIKALRLLARETNKDDSLLIYYAGHGDLDTITGSGWWVPQNAVSQDPSSYIDNAVIQKYIKAIPARHLFLVSDSCFSGTLFGESRSLPKEINNKFYATLYKNRSRWGMTSGNLTTVSDSGTGGHSVFAYQFISALLDNRNPYLTPREIYTKIGPVIRNNSEQMPITKPIKNTDDMGGEFIFIRTNPSAKGSLATLSPSPQVVVQRPDEEEELWTMVKESKDIKDLKLFLTIYPNGRFSTHARLLMKKVTKGHLNSETSIEPKMVSLQSGCFASKEPVYNGRQVKERAIKLCVNDFSMGKYEVTNAEFRKFRPGHNSRGFKGISLNDDNLPVVNVSWRDAKAYIEWLNRKTGKHYRLPNEKEWEYAARAGSTAKSIWNYGYNNPCAYGNIADITMKGKIEGVEITERCSDGYLATAPGGNYYPNEFGLFDLLGNVSEWLEDTYLKPKSTAPKEDIASPNLTKPVRGGSWKTDFMMSEIRFFRLVSFPSNDTGFRIVLSQ